MNIESAGSVLEDLVNDYQTIYVPNVRPIHNLEELRQVYKLTHDCFVSTGYFQAHPSHMIVHYPHFDHLPETEILVAVMNGVFVGSVSVTFDGPAGFTVEEEFKEQCAAIREEGHPMATVWRLVVDPSVRSNRAVLISLVDTVVARIRERDVTLALFAVNPKHERVYCHMLNMEVVARKLETGGRSAPSVLLRADADKIPVRREVHHGGLVFNPIHSLLAAAF